MNHHQQWEQLIRDACDDYVPVLRSDLKTSLKHRLFPPWASFAFLAQAVAGVLLVVGPAVLEEVSYTAYLNVPLPGLAYGAFGILTLLWLVPMALRILQKSSAGLAMLSDQIDETLRLNARRR
jgi:hypothetical protein